jgi:hypothetical protein
MNPKLLNFKTLFGNGVISAMAAIGITHMKLQVIHPEKKKKHNCNCQLPHSTHENNN